MKDYAKLIGSEQEPLLLHTPPMTSTFTMHVAEKYDEPVLVCTVGKTVLYYKLSIIQDLHDMLKTHGDWMLMGSKDEKVATKEGTVEHWARSETNPVGGWYGLRKGYRGRVGMYLPPLMEHLGLAEIEHNKRNNRIRAI